MSANAILQRWGAVPANGGGTSYKMVALPPTKWRRCLATGAARMRVVGGRMRRAERRHLQSGRRHVGRHLGEGHDEAARRGDVISGVVFGVKKVGFGVWGR